MPTRLPPGPRLASMSLEWPPPPNVASTTESSGASLRAATALSSITGRCPVAITRRDPFLRTPQRSRRKSRQHPRRSGPIPPCPRSQGDRPPPWSRQSHPRNRSGVAKGGSCALSHPACARTRLKGPEPCPPTTLHFDPQQRNSCICTENSQSERPRTPLKDRISSVEVP